MHSPNRAPDAHTDRLARLRDAHRRAMQRMAPDDQGDVIPYEEYADVVYRAVAARWRLLRAEEDEGLG